MVFIELVKDHIDCVPKIGEVVNFKEITEEMFEDGLHEDIIYKKQEEFASALNPLPYFITIEQAQGICDALTEKIAEAKAERLRSKSSKKKLKVWLEKPTGTCVNEQFTVDVDSIAEAVEKFVEVRNKYSMGGSSYMYAETGHIVTDFKNILIAHISYSGRVWSRPHSEDNKGRVEILPEEFDNHLSYFEEIPKEDLDFKLGEVYDYGRIHAEISLCDLRVSEDNSHVPGKSELRLIDTERRLFARFILCEPTENSGNSSQYECAYLDTPEFRSTLRKRRGILDALKNHGVGWFVRFEKNTVVNAINGILYNKKQEKADRCEKVFVYNTEEEILDAIYKWKFKKAFQTPFLIATADVPTSALTEDENGAIALKAMVKLNGRDISLLTESTYTGEFGIDWDKYDYVSLTDSDDEHSDVYSWKKEWLANVL